MVVERNEALQINDIHFAVGSTEISVQTDSLNYQFQHLRSDGATRLPTGQGGGVVNFRILIPREDLLRLHRLIVQIKNTPFIFVECKFLRHIFCQSWPLDQNMAFTVISANVENVIGSVGLFELNLQTHWFNYFPYTNNFLFRKEWQTDWLKVDNSDSEKDYTYYKKSIYNYITQKNHSTTPPTGFAKRTEDYMANWSGFIFDMMPAPSNMEQSFAVQNPRDSLIYTRYYNQLQADALMNNFSIDIESDLGYDKYYNNILSGNLNLPEVLDNLNYSHSIHTKMLSFDYFNLAFKVFRYVSLPPSLLDAISSNLGEVIHDKLESSQALDTAEDAYDIPAIIKENVKEWDKLLYVNPFFRRIVCSLLKDMINGDNLSGTKYVKGSSHELIIGETIRSEDANYGSSRSYHKIRTPEGVPDSFAVDINLINTGIWGNHLAGNSAAGIDSSKQTLDYESLVKKGSLSDAIRTQLFHLDYGYLANSRYKSSMTWGGGFDKNYDKYDLMPDRLRNGKIILAHTMAQLVFICDENRKGVVPNYIDIIYPKGYPGGDNPHIQFKSSSYSESALLDKLYSGWRPTDEKGNYIYNNVDASYIDYNGNTVPWYNYIDKLSGKEMTEEDLFFFAFLKELYKDGWKYYDKDPGVNGILEKTIEITVPSTSGNIQLDENGVFKGLFDGGPTDLDTVFTKFSCTLKHIVSSLPICGQEYPTHQHLGSLDSEYAFEFVTQDRSSESKRDGLGLRAQLIESAKNTLQKNARDLKVVYDSWMADVDTFGTRLFGSYFYLGAYPSNDLLVSKHYPELVRKHKKVIINTSNINTIQGNPGLSSYSIGCVDSKPYCGEELKKSMYTTSSVYEDIYRKIISKFFETAVNAGKSPVEQARESYANHLYKKVEDGPIAKSPIFLANEILKDLDKGEKLFFKIDKYFTDTSAFRTSLDINFYTWVSDNEYSEDEKDKLTAIYTAFSSLLILSDLILLEEKFGGIDIYSENLYGFEQHIVPKLEKYSYYELTKTWKGFTSEIIKRSADLTDSFGLFENLNNLGFESAIVAAMLYDLSDITGYYDLAFTASAEFIPFAITDFLSFDKTEINNEVYGFQSTLSPYIKQYMEGRKRPTNIVFGKTDFEKAKLGFIKNALITKCKRIISDPFLVKYFDIMTEVSKLNTQLTSDENELLKDMNLPEHPFYNKKYLTPPDFYYYNYFEDGQYNTQEYFKRVYDASVKDYIDGTYGFMDKLRTGGFSYSQQSGDLTGYEVHGAYEGFNNEIDSEFDKLVGNTDKNAQAKIKPYGYTNPNGQTGEEDTLTFNQGLNSCKFLASTSDKDGIYLPKTSDALISKIKSVEAQFGKKEGYANERSEIAKIINNDEIAFSKDNILPNTYAHTYGKEDIQSIANESMKDLVSNRFRMAGAFPSFRIYLIEEDQSEDFLFKYDDFYHYNAIKEITTVKSREIAADTAIIVMQNISGLLDGSKRRAIRDTDFLYDNKTATGEFTEKGKKIEASRSRSAEDTKDEEAFDSVVLRPGLNIQIRTGYGNNPNVLEVKLSGRIVDVQFSENSDLVEVVVQGFGVELEQQQKNSSEDSNEIFNLTHKILGSLMMSPELIHFGRFEIGTTTQFGELKDQALDFKIYKDNAFYNTILTSFFGTTTPNIKDSFYLRKDKFIDSIDITDLGKFADTNLNPLSIAKHKFDLAESNIETGTSLLWDTVTSPISAVSALYDKVGTLIQNSITEKIAYALPSPQDDNLFPPHPKDYLARPNWVYSAVVDGIRAWWKTGSLGKGIAKLSRSVLQGFVSEKSTLDELNYVMNGMTIFQIFHEMSLRHPGYVYAPIPYGKDFRYTMFFGVPSQRYWSKPAHPLFIERVNDLRAALSSPLNDSRTVQEISFSSNLSTFSDLKKYIDSIDIPFVDDTSSTEKSSFNKSDDTYLDSLRSLNINTLQDGLIEYYNALTLRFEPFRRYHYASSDNDIIINNLVLSDYNVANAVAVKYYSSETSEEDSIELEDNKIVKIHENISDYDLRIKDVDWRNIHSANMALKYGIGELVYESKHIYDGSILLRGNSRIKPWDVVFLWDKYNDICGPVEVEQVVEKFSFETGFVTEIKPNALVFANEVSSLPIIEGLKSVFGAVTKQQDQYFPKYSGNSMFTNISTFALEPLQTLDHYIYNDMFMNKRNITDIVEYASYQINKTIGLPSDTSVIGDYSTVNETIVSTPLQALFNSGAWLLGGLLYLNKCSQGQSIIIYPLLKNGLPYVAGIPQGRPETMYKIFRGQISSFFEDVSKGTTDYLDYWKLLGLGALGQFTKSSSSTEKTALASDRL